MSSSLLLRPVLRAFGRLPAPRPPRELHPRKRLINTLKSLGWRRQINWRGDLRWFHPDHTRRDDPHLGYTLRIAARRSHLAVIT